MRLMERRVGRENPGRHSVPLYGPAPSSAEPSDRALHDWDYVLPDASTWMVAIAIDADLSSAAPALDSALKRVLSDSHLLDSPRTIEDRVAALHEQTSLTWQQLARLFGVSRRAVHLWAKGNRMSSANLDRLARIEEAVAPLLGLSPEHVRDAMMERQGGSSLFAQLLQEVAEAQPRSEPRSWVERSSVEP